MTLAEIETLLKEIKEEILGDKPKEFNKLGIDKITHFKGEKICSSDRKFRSEKTHCLIGSAKQVRMRGSGERSTTLPQCDSPTS